MIIRLFHIIINIIRPVEIVNLIAYEGAVNILSYVVCLGLVTKERVCKDDTVEGQMDSLGRLMYVAE